MSNKIEQAFLDNINTKLVNTKDCKECSYFQLIENNAPHCKLPSGKHIKNCALAMQKLNINN